MSNRLTKEQDKERVSALFHFDANVARELSDLKDPVILGIDEVGRGPIAGPVAAGGVIFEKEEYIEYLNDSKKITEKRRPVVAEKIEQTACFSDVCMVDAKTVDEIGIIDSLKIAFRELVSTAKAAGFVPDLILIDGNKIDLRDSRVHCIVKGDMKSASIAGASVVAKVKRDAFMAQISHEFPDFEWEKNKGYGTKAHFSAIKRLGITPYHRKSFLKNVNF